MPTRMQLEIYSHTVQFKKRFHLDGYTDRYLCFKCVMQYRYCLVTIYCTCAKCYRVMTYKSYCSTRKESEYKSFRTLSELCNYLEDLAISLN